jgi:hypothetical protein
MAGEMNAYHEERSDTWKESERGEDFIERLESVQEMVTLIRDLP